MILTPQVCGGHKSRCLTVLGTHVHSMTGRYLASIPGRAVVSFASKKWRSVSRTRLRIGGGPLDQSTSRSFGDTLTLAEVLALGAR